MAVQSGVFIKSNWDARIPFARVESLVWNFHGGCMELQECGYNVSKRIYSSIKKNVLGV